MQQAKILRALYALCLCSLDLTLVNSLQIEITSAGRNAKIGDLYDATKSDFTGQNLFTTAEPPGNNSIKTTAITQAGTKLEVVDSFSEKVDLLDIETSLAIDVAIGRVKATGAVSNIKDHMKNGKRKEAWLIHRIRTVQQFLYLSSDLIRSYFSPEVLQTTSATHFVLGIKHGADILFKIFTQEFQRKHKHEIKDDLDRHINSGNLTDLKYFISVYSDVFLQTYPRNIQEVLSLLTDDVQGLIGHVNSGMGKPIKYILLPLDDLKSYPNLRQHKFKAFQPINDSMLKKSYQSFERISKANKHLEQIQATLDTYNNCADPEEQSNFQMLKDSFENSVFDFKQNISTTLESIRSVRSNSSSLSKAIADYSIEIFGVDDFERKIQNSTTNSNRKIEIYNQFISAGAEYIGKGDSFEVIRWQTMDRALFVLFYNLALIQNDPFAWQENTRLMTGPLNKLINRLVIVDCDYNALQCNGLNKTVIQEFRQGALTQLVVKTESQGDKQCIFESVSLDSLQKRFQDYQESTRLTIETLNTTIQQLLKNNSELSEQYLYNFVNAESQSKPIVAESSQRQNISSEFLAELTTLPKARLYNRENCTGQYEEFTVFSPWNKGSCFNLGTLNQLVRSADTFGTCVRLFQLMDCAGWSWAVYPGSEDTNSLDPRLGGVFSIGPCLSNEFDRAWSIDISEEGSSASRKIARKIPMRNGTSEFSNPDWILFGGVDNYMDSYHLWDKENPITNFKQGANGRVEYIRAFINHMHVRSEIQVNDLEMSSFTRRQYEQLDKEEGDTVGYAIPLKYGGPEDEIYNIFSQSVAGQTRWMHQLDLALTDNMSEGVYGLATIYLNFMYSNVNVSRPSAFSYHISLNGPNDSDRVRYGVIEN